MLRSLPHLRSALIYGVLASCLGFAGPLGAQESPAVEPPAAEAPAPEELPGAHEVVPRYLDLTRRSEAAEAEIAELTEVADLEGELAEAETRQEELAELYAKIREETYPRRHRVSQLRELGRQRAGALESLSQRVSDRLRRLGDIRSEFQQHQIFWQQWRQRLEQRGELEGLEQDVSNALTRIDEMLDLASQAFGVVVDLQRRLETLQQRQEDLLARADALLERGRERWLERDAPPLVSAEFFASLGEETWAQSAAALEALSRMGADRFRALGWIFWLHLLFAVLAGLLVREIRRRGHAGRRWSGILEHPWAVGAFVSTAVLSPWYEPMAPWWELVLVTVLAVSGAVLASDLFDQRAKRQVVYALAAFYPLFLLAELVALPEPWLRLFLAVAAALGAVLGWWTAGRLAVTSRSSRGFHLVLRLGAVLLGAAVVAETAGYDRLARWLVESSVATAFVIFVTTFLVRLGRGGLQALVSRGGTERWSVLERVGDYLATRATWLLQAVLVVSAGLYVLHLWRLIPAPVESLDRLLEAGIPPEDPAVTLGQLAIAALAVYLAFIGSRVLRALLHAEVFERRDFDPGLGDSIQTLLHYAVVTFGFLVGLSLLGVSLQNFAIVAGALGVGIGFGLQNIVHNFVSGLILLFERPVRAGDVIIIDGEWATVQKIGMRSTVVVTFDRSEIIVPNSDLISEKVTNWTLSDKVARIIIPLGVAYGSDLETVFRLLREVVDAHGQVLRNPEPVVHFVGFGDSSLNFEIRIWVEEIQVRLDVRSEILEEIDRRFREAGVTIPFPQRDLHVRTFPERSESETR